VSVFVSTGPLRSGRHAPTVIRRTRAAMSHKRIIAASAIRPHPRKDYRDCIQLVQHRRGSLKTATIAVVISLGVVRRCMCVSLSLT
jgi:hypothetical protein